MRAPGGRVSLDCAARSDDDADDLGVVARYIVFQALAHTLSLPREKWRVLDQAHTARNKFEYHGEVAPSEKVLESVRRITREMLALLRAQQ